MADTGASFLFWERLHGRGGFGGDLVNQVKLWQARQITRMWFWTRGGIKECVQSQLQMQGILNQPGAKRSFKLMSSRHASLDERVWGREDQIWGEMLAT